MKTEKWKDIPGFERRYQASTKGRIRSLDRFEFFPAYTTGTGLYRSASKRYFKGRVLKSAVSRSGHLCVVLRRKKQNKGGTKAVHALIAKTFIGKKPKDKEVLHKNHKPADNRPSNLKYGTRSENVRMMIDSGRFNPAVNFRGARGNAQ